MLGDQGKECRVCVTGAGGYIASWLVKNLLAKGYNVNATFRDPGNESKTRHILSLPGARERLTLFKADINKEGSFDSALHDCDFVVHLATPMDFTADAEAQKTVVEAEVKGTLDILRACSKAKSVRRVIYTSSINAASPLIDKGEFRDCVDESCWTPVDLIRREKPLFWMYYVSKTLAEQAALQYGSDHGIEVVTIAPSLVAGPSLTSTLPASIEEALGLITGSQECYEWLKEFQWLMGSIALVHTDDLCNAYIFLMEHPSAKGRYICSAQDLTLKELWDFCRKRYSQFCPPIEYPNEDDFLKYVPVSSKRLMDLGFSYKYGLPEIFDESIEFAKKIEILQ
jgi:bifunctional dihydroflavonol 4-reductase/flavanone 4-reductase